MMRCEFCRCSDKDGFHHDALCPGMFRENSKIYELALIAYNARGQECYQSIRQQVRDLIGVDERPALMRSGADVQEAAERTTSELNEMR